MSSMTSRNLDIILFGASGYTGKYCIKEIHRLTKVNGRFLTWGVAGRSETKLRAVLSECQKQIGDDLSEIPVIIANIEDSHSLRQMTAQSRIIINCCGPYRFYGEPLIKACIETGTHQVDVAGEPQYMENIQLKYHKVAQERGIYIVSSCGFDSIPADLGVVFMQKNFKGILNSIETYLHMTSEGVKTGPHFNYATWEALVHSIANAKELVHIRRKLYQTPLPKFKPQLKAKPPVQKTHTGNGWIIPFFGADRSVIYRTQRHLYESEDLRPVQVQTYEVVNSLFTVIARVFYGSLFQSLAKYKCGRDLLLKYPVLFSAGTFTRRTPSEEVMKKTKFCLTFQGNGWDVESVKNAEHVQKQPLNPPNKTVVGYITGYDPAYGVTAISVTLAAIVILTDTEKLPKGGGVYTPGAAFAKTSLIEQLQSNGLVYKIKCKL
ncbi:hypothetical protein ILUMI_20646 [Ignelater luminosus]|uniref:Saccharopine dehydrogenase NADP binding domain-containing protein n=1 Tax=Ignelater luminosus TaxID=2038154 RepID=A0A8K0G4C3_IGNLU|nr:hypothetical protein ILUMI_20646 [Ignelater luminosus]